MSWDYDAIVIGGGPAGMVASKVLVGFGKKTLLVEKRALGGDCTWFGCIPSKALLSAAKAINSTKNISKFGIDLKIEQINSDNVFKTIRESVAKIYANETPEIFEKSGVKVELGEAKFLDNHTIIVNQKKLTAKYFILATGSKTDLFNLDGLDSVEFLTNETIFNLNKIPKSIIILGSGAIAIEMATALNRLGSNVTILLRSDVILKKDDLELTTILKKTLTKDGVNFIDFSIPKKVFQKDDKKVLIYEKNNSDFSLQADEILIATGRYCDLENLDLKNANIEYSKKGVITDKTLKTTANNIYACGDVVGPYQFTHMAEYQAVIASSNIVLPIKKRVDYSNVCWSTFCDPPLANTGISQNEAIAKYGEKSINIFRFEYKNLDRSFTDKEEIGLAKYICLKDGTILGASILGTNAGELINEIQVAKTLDIAFYKLASVIHTYPSFSDIIRQPAKLCYLDKINNNPIIKLIKKFKK